MVKAEEIKRIYTLSVSDHKMATCVYFYFRAAQGTSVQYDSCTDHHYLKWF